jgi:hypothetical protein
VKAEGPTIVPLASADPYSGFVLVDFLATELAVELAPSGQLTAATVDAISSALRIALP